MNTKKEFFTNKAIFKKLEKQIQDDLFERLIKKCYSFSPTVGHPVKEWLEDQSEKDWTTLK